MSNEFKIKVYGNSVIVEPILEKPENCPNRMIFGKVVSIGPDVKEFKPGDRVILGIAIWEIEFEGKKYIFLGEGNIDGKVCECGARVD